MSTPSIDERREVAGLLRTDVPTECGLSDGELLDELYSIVVPRGSVFTSTEEYDAAFLRRLADLIDPTAHERTVADNLALIDRNRELEIELASCKAKLGRVSRIADRLRGECRMAVLRIGDAPVPSSVADRLEIAAEIAEVIR